MKILGQYFPSYKIGDNIRVFFRRLTEADVIPLVEFYYHLSQQTRYMRFQMVTEGLPESKIYEYAEMLCRVEGKGLAIVAYTYENGIENFVGVARYMFAGENENKAEFAIVIRDDFQGKGLGKYLLRLLFAEAQRHGIEKLYGTMLPANVAIIELIKKVAPCNHHFSHNGGLIEVEINLNE
ncbi:MAG: GNAT family N-acetyltransferase [Raineya sp.]|nr:GNAT family N-acetyltransferase [Raineya sp.]MDW8296834.1 GNAT family N-acetyltransferase [Raineya sp.]